MINLLILYELNKSPLTMYGISKQIKSQFAVMMKPSLGTLQPALKKLEKAGFVNSQKYMSPGGRPSICYAITNKGKDALNKEILSDPAENPIQFLVNARIRLCCAEILEKEDFIKLLKLLKRKTESLMLDTKQLLESSKITQNSSVVFDNLACEYRNFLSLLEGLEHASNS